MNVWIYNLIQYQLFNARYHGLTHISIPTLHWDQDSIILSTFLFLFSFPFIISRWNFIYLGPRNGDLYTPIEDLQ